MKFSEGQGVVLLPLFHYIEDLFNPYHCISFIGGGGKTSLMMYTSDVLRNNYDKILITTTTHLSSNFSYNVDLITDSYDKAAAVNKGCVLFVGKNQDNRFSSPDLEEVNKLSKLYDKVLIEADGSKMLPLKYHNINEPVIPEFSDFVVSLVGLDSLGRSINEVMHRYEEFLLSENSIYNYSDKDGVKISDIKKLIEEPNGCYKGVLDRKKSILIFNKVDCVLDSSNFKEVCNLTKTYGAKTISVRDKYLILC